MVCDDDCQVLVKYNFHQSVPTQSVGCPLLAYVHVAQLSFISRPVSYVLEKSYVDTQSTLGVAGKSYVSVHLGCFT